MAFSSERGASPLTLLVFGTIVGLLIFYGYSVGPFFYAYYEIQNQADNVIRVAQTEDDASIRRKLKYHIKKLALPVDPDADLIIERTEHYIKIRMDYTEVFYITWKKKDHVIQTFDFKVRAEGAF